MIEEGLKRVRGKASKSHIRFVLVHEVAHAMDHKRFGRVWGTMGKASPEQREVWRAVIEGSAQVVTWIVGQRWHMNEEVEDHLELVQGDLDPVPHWKFAYIQGYAFMKAVYDRYGRKGLDYVLGHPPAKKYAIAHPQAWMKAHADKIAAAGAVPTR